MPRKIPPPPEFGPVGARASLVWRVCLSLVTPMLGGGHRAKEIDEATPISGKAIRGHLRFWWRYMCASHVENASGLPPIELMRLREGEVFGAQDVRSPFDIVIEDVGTVRPLQSNGGDGPDEGYVLFPLRDAPGSIVGPGLSFTLVVRWLDQDTLAERERWEIERREKSNRDRRAAGESEFPMPLDMRQIRNQFNTALWAWLSFGGLGSRIRRGLGCLSIVDAKSSGLYSFEKGKTARHTPCPEIYYLPKTFGDDARAAWLAGVCAYREFRQSARGPQHPKSWLKMEGQFLKRVSGNVQGRSKWPEPDSIRMATGCALTGTEMYLENGTLSPTPTQETIKVHDHTTPMATGGTLPAYPRAALGLPIIFHFADGPRIGKSRTRTYSQVAGIPASNRDPDEATLAPMVVNTDGDLVPRNRMASPVITKPIRLHDGWHAAIIILRPPELDGLTAELRSTAGRTPIRADQIAGQAVSGFAPMRGKPSALDALGAFLLTRHFKLYGAGQ